MSEWISDERALEAARRFIDEHFHNERPKPVTRIPAREDDDDVVLTTYIIQRAARDREREAAIMEECAAVLLDEVRQHRNRTLAHNFCEDYGCHSLEEFAEKIRALRPGASSLLKLRELRARLNEAGEWWDADNCAIPDCASCRRIAGLRAEVAKLEAEGRK